MLQLNKLEFIEQLNKISFLSHGDNNEKKYRETIVEYFPNIEIFWKYFIVPMTKRIENFNYTDASKIRKREEIPDDLYEIAIINYSTFKKLCFAFEQLPVEYSADFEEFYAHMGSVCDLTEEFFLKIYTLKLELCKTSSETLQYLSKSKFLKICNDWYNENYSKVYQHYLSKGKFISISLPQRINLLDEYFGLNSNWKEYKNFTKLIKEYRNVLIHSSVIGKIFSGTLNDIQVLVPKKSVISKYKKLGKIFEIAENSDRIKYDFINMKEQMSNDWKEMLQYLNKLWELAIVDFNALLYNSLNEFLLSKYDIKFV